MVRVSKQILDKLPSLGYLLRALGLDHINTLLRSSLLPESAKPALQNSKWAAISRSAIHIIPITISSFLIWLNIRTYYMGPGLSFQNANDSVYLALYQIASKLMEMLCVASLAAVIFQVLRHYLCEDGVPFGLLGAGLSFGQLSYLWSSAFCSSIRPVLFDRRRWPLFLLLVVACVLAATIGPALAVLLLPRVQAFPAGGTTNYLNATADKLWPTQIDSSSQYLACFLPNATNYDACPCSGYTSIKETFAEFYYSDFLVGTDSMQPKLRAMDELARYFSFEVHSTQGLLPVMMSAGELRNKYRTIGTFTSQPSAVVAVQQSELLNDWYGIIRNTSLARSTLQSSAEYKYLAPLTCSVRALSPLVRTRCSSTAQNLSVHATTAEFPTMKWDSTARNIHWQDSGYTANIESLERNFSSSLRAQWVSLPTEDFGSVSAGLLFEMPWISGGLNNGSSRTAVGCTAQAYWYQGTTITTADTSYLAWIVKEGQDAVNTPASNVTQLLLHPTWLNLLTPQAPDLQAPSFGRPLNTLEAVINATHITNYATDMLSNSTPYLTALDGSCVNTPATKDNITETSLWNQDCNPAKISLLETILAVFLADGLSRLNSMFILKASMDPDAWSVTSFPRNPTYLNDLVAGRDAFLLPQDLSHIYTLKTTIAITGYAYYASVVTDYLSIVVVGLYVLIAVSHLFWILRPRHFISSASWDSVIELAALCQNSPSTMALYGTSAGIGRLSTYKKIVKLRAVQAADNSSDERVVLLFDETIDELSEGRNHIVTKRVEAIDGNEEVNKSVGLISDQEGVEVTTSEQEPFPSLRQRTSLSYRIKNLASSSMNAYTWPLMANNKLGMEGAVEPISAQNCKGQSVSRDNGTENGGAHVQKVEVGKKYV